jgi:uncharacterized protein
MDIYARDHETSVLEKFFISDKPELMAVYGRRRVGKTFLIKNFFYKKNNLFFHVTGVEKGSYLIQRTNFCRRISEVFHSGLPLSVPKDWNGLFELLKKTIDSTPKNKKIILFFDEFPWMVTPRAKLLEVLEYFWNEYWSNDKRIKLVICGSIASWIIRNIINNTGGLFQRVTYRLKIEPFKLGQAKQFLYQKNIKLTNQQVASLYMAVGGIPLYLEQAQRGMTTDQIIDQICFNKNGLLFDELKELFKSLFKNEKRYLNIVKEIANHRHGIAKNDLAKKLKLPRGGRLTDRLIELEDAGFIISFIPYQNKERGEFFKIIDEYTMFYFNWIAPNLRAIKNFTEPSGIWQDKTKDGSYYSWKGSAFESLCYKHITNIMQKLNLRKSSVPYSWRTSAKASRSSQGTQIDLLFDRPDDAITLCEIKYSKKPFVIDKSYAKNLENKRNVFSEEARIKKQIFIAIISANGIKENKYSKELVDQTVTLEDLF